MKNAQKLILAVIAAFLLISTVMASGKWRDFRGTIVAFDPSYHSLKQASFVKNLEVTIADVGGKPSNQIFIKLIFEGFGTEQVADDVLSGRTAFRVRAVRDTSCDEAHPRLLTKAESFEGSGAFLLNQTHQTQSLDAISALECYRVQVKK
ncbi:MAG TPA: hypothetical protein VFI45_22475 [Candidatus Acidoferrum sp.]|nr:hypothetical protein [Candidatus Acidoferrum sp.]